MTYQRSPTQYNLAKLPAVAFTPLIGDECQVIKLVAGEYGYREDKRFPSEKEARFYCDMMNKIVGCSPAQEEAMIAGSVFGFHAPAANPEIYA